MADDDASTGDGTEQDDPTGEQRAEQQSDRKPTEDANQQADRRDQAGRQQGAQSSDSAADESAEDDDSGAPEKRFTQADLDKKIAERLKREQAKYADYGDLKKQADELKKLKDAEKSESERLSDQLAEREVELQQLRVEKVRNSAGHEAGLDPDLWEYITASDPDEALAQAQKLVEKTKQAAPPRPAKTEQGARVTPRPAKNPNDLLRDMAGRST